MEYDIQKLLVIKEKPKTQMSPLGPLVTRVISGF